MVTPAWFAAALRRGSSPPTSMKAPRIVFVHQIKVQFCWNGVTGMIAARSGGCEAMPLDGEPARPGQASNRRRGAPLVAATRPSGHSAAMLTAGLPFVLLDDARPGGPHILYREPLGIVEVHHPDEVAPALDRLRAAVAEGKHAAGWIAYEAGIGLEPRLAALAHPGGAMPLLWFG